MDQTNRYNHHLYAILIFFYKKKMFRNIICPRQIQRQQNDEQQTAKQQTTYTSTSSMININNISMTHKRVLQRILLHWERCAEAVADFAGQFHPCWRASAFVERGIIEGQFKHNWAVIKHKWKDIKAGTGFFWKFCLVNMDGRIWKTQLKLRDQLNRPTSLRVFFAATQWKNQNWIIPPNSWDRDYPKNHWTLL